MHHAYALFHVDAQRWVPSYVDDWMKFCLHIRLAIPFSQDSWDCPRPSKSQTRLHVLLLAIYLLMAIKTQDFWTEKILENFGGGSFTIYEQRTIAIIETSRGREEAKSRHLCKLDEDHTGLPLLQEVDAVISPVDPCMNPFTNLPEMFLVSTLRWGAQRD
ncbi:hypothetical protein VNO77_04102 [Canavalia gladiata]|uniref:Uncharacterized protein n=1 Tax=Canavalia gladiata TaxID=3824 RepID=A0AAN9MVX7_CANGL